MSAAEDKQKRVAYILQKKASLKRAIENLKTYLDTSGCDFAGAQFRLDRINTLFTEYGKNNYELATLSPGHPDFENFDEIENDYYEVGSAVKRLQVSTPLASSTLNTRNITISERQDRPKFPTIQIPKFNGKHDQLVAWKHSFENIVHFWDDLSNYINHTQLINSVSGTAAKKIIAFPPSDENYPKAWEALCEAFDQKRIIVAEHLDAILELSVLTRANLEELSLLIDDTKQHVSMLRELKIELNMFSEQMIIRILEKRLPPGILTKWHERLDGNELPSLEDLYKFIQATVFRLKALDRVASSGRGAAEKRLGEKGGQPFSKVRKVEGRSLVTSAHTSVDYACYKCSGNHRIYQCPSFEKLTNAERWKYIKANGLCRNCFGKHKTPCTRKAGSKKCNRDHNTMLHLDKAPPSSKVETSQRGEGSTISGPKPQA